MARRAPRTDPADLDRALCAAALDELVGAVLVLDANLRIRVATPDAAALLAAPVPTGASAATLLCGDRPKRPFAEALAAGLPFQAVIPRPGELVGGEQVRVRSVPIPGDGGEDGGPPLGWIVYLAPVASGDGEPVQFHGMWTRDARMKETFRIIEKVAGEEITVLVRGETGTGKELTAHALHALSPRRDGPFRAINCAALPANLLESELFGHVKGAFTGAVKDTPGHVQLAHGGTLFLDEVAELPLELQAKLLRVLETRTVLPVGGRDAIPVDVRVVSATHRALRAEVEAGRFRADLMFRLRVIPVRLPPLRERPADVALLTDKLIAELNARGRRQIERVAPAAAIALERHEWPGNVRELRNVLAYAFAIGEGPVLELHDLPDELASLTAPGAEVVVPAAPTAADDGSPELRRIRDALARTGGNRDRAAKLLGWSRVTLWRRMRSLGLA
ncbi:MAG: sigma 54-interacting transcriptional regulator [Kofleriaceae bacterium]|nr:sigma 54-interacting transcriptional regulator [Kofleriaceae bacterium]MCL4224445.1 sigma 54-interacting transcriptional regulator [Myxococcales bacterium]